MSNQVVRGHDHNMSLSGGIHKGYVKVFEHRLKIKKIPQKQQSQDDYIDNYFKLDDWKTLMVWDAECKKKKKKRKTVKCDATPKDALLHVYIQQLFIWIYKTQSAKPFQ